jgi:hypothetical protein
MSKRPVLSIPLALALVAAVAAAGSVQAASPRTAVPSTAASGSSLTLRTSSVVAKRVKITGQVMLIYSNGSFRLNNRVKNFKVVMRPTTSVINLNGREVPRQFIQVANKVTVTGKRVGSRITARVVKIYTRKDGP